ncbi:MAG: ABC transporter substrate-binding protein [Thermodesulfobacteriota bacterium]
MFQRAFVHHTAIMVCCLVFLPSFAPAQEQIKIGFLYCFSGRLSHYGEAAKRGGELAIKEINSQGGLSGRKLLGIYEDTELKPEVGVARAKKLILEDKVDVLMGIVSSEVARAVAPVANEHRTPLIITLAMTPDVTGKMCNPYTFRISQNGPQNLMGASILASGMQAKKWNTVGPDYVFGYQCWEYFQKYLKEKRPDVQFASKSEAVYGDVTTTDWKPYITKVLQSGADGVLISLYGGNLIDFVRQATPMGLFDGKRQILMNLALSSEVMCGLGVNMPQGVWLSGLYWFQSNEGRTNRLFVDTYMAAHNVFPDYNAHGAYTGVKTYAAAFTKAGSAQKEGIVTAMKGISVDIPAGKLTIRPEDHQAVCPGVWGKTANLDQAIKCRILYPLKIFPGEEIAVPASETGCSQPARTASQ